MYKSKTESGVEFTADIIKTEKELGRSHSLEIVFIYDSSNERVIYRNVLCCAYYGFVERAEENPREAVKYYSDSCTDRTMNDLVKHIREKLTDADLEQIKLMVHEHYTDMFHKIRLHEGIKLGRGKGG